jgi:hypothetical protein
VAESLERRTADSPTILLHDRRMPTGAGNIDHLAIAPTGVFVIDAKNYRGKVEVRKPLLGAPKLVIDGRDRTKLIDGLDRQVAAVQTALRASRHADVPVRGVLCFTTAELPLLGTLKMRGHLLLYRKALAKRLNAQGALAPAVIEDLARDLQPPCGPRDSTHRIKPTAPSRSYRSCGHRGLALARPNGSCLHRARLDGALSHCATCERHSQRYLAIALRDR